MTERAARWTEPVTADDPTRPLAQILSRPYNTAMCERPLA